MIPRLGYLYFVSHRTRNTQQRFAIKNDLWLNNAITSQRCWDVNMATLALESLMWKERPAGGALFAPSVGKRLETPTGLHVCASDGIEHNYFV